METQRLILRKFKRSDWQDLYEYLSDERVVRYEPYQVFTEEECRYEAEGRSNDDSFWAVCLKESGKLIGNVYLAKQRFETWELGYTFNINFQGKGYATEATQALVSHAFANGHARRIIAMCNPVNLPSWQLLERIKFRKEGHLIQNICYEKDEYGAPIWSDTYLYGLLVSEWH